MGIRNKACIMVTLGAAFGIKDHMNMIKSNSCALIKPEWTATVSEILQANLLSGDLFGRSKELLRTGNQERKRAEELVLEDGCLFELLGTQLSPGLRLIRLSSSNLTTEISMEM